MRGDRSGKGNQEFSFGYLNCGVPLRYPSGGDEQGDEEFIIRP